MDAFFKPKNKPKPEQIVLDDDELELILDPDILVLDSLGHKKQPVAHDQREDTNQNINPELEVVETVIFEKKQMRLKQSLKQLLSGNAAEQKRKKTESQNATNKPKNIKSQHTNINRIRSDTSLIITKEVEIIEKSQQEGDSVQKAILKQMLSGRSSKVLDQRIGDVNDDDSQSGNSTNSLQSFFQQNKLRRFHSWSSKKTMDNPTVPEIHFINNYDHSSANKKVYEKTFNEIFKKRTRSETVPDEDNFDYSNKISPVSGELPGNKKRRIELPAKRIEDLYKRNSSGTSPSEDEKLELWTEHFKPQRLEDMATILSQETISTFKYQLLQSFNKLSQRNDNERELLNNNWKSLLKHEENSNSDDGFVVHESDEESKPLEHIPLFVLYGPGVGKNLLLELTLDELKNEGLPVGNILEMNASIERSKKSIFDTCFEAATSKFLQKDEDKNSSLGDKRKQNLGEKRKQCLGGGVILFDEVDNLFLSDKLFYPMILKLLQVTKKPIIFTCNFIDCIPEQLLKITDFQQTNFLIPLPETTVPYLNKTLGLKLGKNHRYTNINRDIRHTLMQLQLDRYVEMEVLDKNKKPEEPVAVIGVSELARSSDYLSEADLIQTMTLNKSCIKHGLDYSITDFIESEDVVDEECDYSSKQSKLRLDGTINYYQWRNIDRLKRPYKNFYDEETSNQRLFFEIDVGASVEKLIIKQLPGAKKLSLLNPQLDALNRVKLSRNLYLKLEYMQLNMLPYHMKLSPTRATVSDYLTNLQTSEAEGLDEITLRSLLNRNYQILDNKLNYEFTSSNNLFCYHYPFFKTLVDIDLQRRKFVQNVLNITLERGNIDNTAALKHLLKEQQIKSLVFDQDPRIYWHQ